MATQFGDAGNNSLTGSTGNDTLDGLAGNDLLYGNTGDDVITAGDGFSTVYGGMGNDSITAGNGNDLIVGGEGDDTAVFSGTIDSYTVTQNKDGSYTVAGNDGIDTVSGVEHLKFDDFTDDPNSIVTGVHRGGGAMPAPIPVAKDVVTALPDTNAVIFINPSISGNVLSNESDSFGKKLNVSNPQNYQGSHENLSLRSSGDYTYNQTNFASSGTDVFEYVATDGVVSAESTLTITATGLVNVAL